jgi:hypothetical protein
LKIGRHKLSPVNYPPPFSPGKRKMFQILFIISLFLIVLIALEMEAVLVPNIVFQVFGAASLVFGIVLFLSGYFRRQTAAPDPPGEKPVSGSGGEKPAAPSSCLAAIVGSMYALVGIGVLGLQLIGYLYLR